DESIVAGERVGLLEIGPFECELHVRLEIRQTDPPEGSRIIAAAELLLGLSADGEALDAVVSHELRPPLQRRRRQMTGAEEKWRLRAERERLGDQRVALLGAEHVFPWIEDGAGQLRRCCEFAHVARHPIRNLERPPRVLALHPLYDTEGARVTLLGRAFHQAFLDRVAARPARRA